MSELWAWGAVELAKAIRTRKVSSREAVSAALKRLDAVNPKINAVVESRRDEALAAADAADTAIARGDSVGALHGVPVTIKVNIDQKGYATTNGVVAFKDIVAKEDSPVVANWRKAGAVFIGRTNTPAFSHRWFTDNALHGQTLNPLDKGRTPGGSSGGAAAAMAAGIGALAHGNDYGGSVRYPAYACGLVGVRGTLGRVPAYNPTTAGAKERVISAQLMSVQGPLARSVADARLGLHAMAQRDARDPWWVPAPLEGPPLARPIRVAMIADAFGDGVHPAVKAAIEQAGKWLQEAGCVVEEKTPPMLQEATELWSTIVMSDGMRGLKGAVDQFGDKPAQETFYDMAKLSPHAEGAAFLEALEKRSAILRAWNLFLEDYPLVLMPVSMEPPFEQGLDLQGANAMGRILAAQRPLLALALLGLPCLSVPTGIDHGVAMGVQLVGQRYREDTCLAAAEVIEARANIKLPVDPA
ncbi:MAG: amidase family protein [Rhodospirillales bacterium]